MRRRQSGPRVFYHGGYDQAGRMRNRCRLSAHRSGKVRWRCRFRSSERSRGMGDIKSRRYRSDDGGWIDAKPDRRGPLSTWPGACDLLDLTYSKAADRWILKRIGLVPRQTHRLKKPSAI